MCRVLACLLCFILPVLIFPSCGRRETPPPSAMEVLTAMQAAMTDTAQPLPDGLT